MGNKPHFYTQFDLPPNRNDLKCTKASLTRQEFVEEADINNIMKRYAAGMPLPSGDRPPMFGDFTDIPDYQKSLDIVIDAQNRFMQLPSKVRREFGDDPAQLLEFLQHEENRDRAIELGLIEKPVQKPVQKPVVSVSVPETKGEGEA